jgi:LysM repeat protein
VYVTVCLFCALLYRRSGDADDDDTGAVHVMGEKEKISAVSTKYGVAVGDLMKWNGVLDRLAFYPGQVVRLTAPKALVKREELAEQAGR